MIEVAGIWELGWNTPIVEHDIWAYPLRDFGVDAWHMCPVSGIRSEHVIEHPDLGELIENKRNAGKQIVFVDEGGDTDLEDFQHPVDPLYVFGKASMSPLRAYKKEGDLSIRITTPNNLATMWPHQTAVMVLYDLNRKKK